MIWQLKHQILQLVEGEQNKFHLLSNRCCPPQLSNLLLDRFRIRTLKIHRNPISPPLILGRQQAIRHHLASPFPIPPSVRHIRHYWQPPYILKREIVQPRPRPRAERPNDVFEIVHIDVIADEEDAVDEH